MYLETWLTAAEDTAPIDRCAARHFPLLQRNPLTESEQFTFVKRTDPQRLPRLDTVGGLFVTPDRLIHGLGIDALPWRSSGSADHRRLDVGLRRRGTTEMRTLSPIRKKWIVLHLNRSSLA